METLLVDIKNQKEKKILTAFLSSLGISFRAESDEDAVLVQWYDKVKAKKEKPVPFDAEKLRK